jgi:hypothetical protein
MHFGIVVRITAMLLLWLVFLPVGAHAAGGIDPRKCAVQLSARDEDGRDLGRGTAIYADGGNGAKYLITALHVVHNCAAVRLEFDPNGVKFDDLTDIAAPRFRVDSHADVCVFTCTAPGVKRLEEMRGKRAIPLASEDIAPGTHVTAIGNPRIRVAGKVSYPLNYAANASVSEYAALSARLPAIALGGKSGQTRGLFLENLQITRGYSGGPVIVSRDNFLTDRYVLAGMIQGGDISRPVHCWAIPADVLRRAISDGQAESQFPPPAWPPLLIGGLVLPPQDSILEQKLPVTRTRANKFWNGHGEFTTSVTIGEGGRIDVITSGWYTGGAPASAQVAIYLCDREGRILWKQPNAKSYELSADRRDVSDKWSAIAAESTTAAAERLVIHQRADALALDEVFSELAVSDANAPHDSYVRDFSALIWLVTPTGAYLEVEQLRELVKELEQRTDQVTQLNAEVKNLNSEVAALKRTAAGTEQLQMTVDKLLAKFDEQSRIANDLQAQINALKAQGAEARMGEEVRKRIARAQGAARLASQNNLKQIGIALHNFADVNSSGLDSLFGVDQKPPLSWRVLILPYLEQKGLYDVVFDSQGRLIPERLPLVPNAFHSPIFGSRDTQETSYVAIRGPGTALGEPGKKAARAEINDGTANLIMVMEVECSGIKWFEPRDFTVEQAVEYVRSRPEGSWINVVRADASVIAIHSQISTENLLRLLRVEQAKE